MYCYGGNNPVRYVDPDGRVAFCVVTSIIGFGIGATYGAYKSWAETGSIDCKELLADAVVCAVVGFEIGLIGAQVATSAVLTTGNCLAGFSEVTGLSTIVTTSVSSTTLTCSKYLEELNKFSDVKIKHFIEGSKNSVHNWEKLVPDKNWDDIKNIINKVMENGIESSYKTVLKKVLEINGYEITVTFNRLSNGVEKISDAWIN